MFGTKDAKAEQLAQDTRQVGEDGNARLTADFGTRMSNTDDWLRIQSGDRTGPMLLEDPFAREKVGLTVAGGYHHVSNTRKDPSI